MDNQNIQDPRTIGTSGLKGVNRNNDIPVLSVNQLLRARNKASLEARPVEYLGNEFEGMGIGSSTYDKAASSIQQLEEIGDVRAQEQSRIIQLANGVLKGTAIAGTTFLDGTVGALYGLIQGGAALFDDDQRTGFWENMFNNDFSKALREGNRALEEILPNYRSRDEIENPWALRNVFSMNTFADDFLKNIGFTVGAFYSGNAFLGGLKALKAAKWMSNTAAKTWGSIVSGFNEGRIEAGNLYDDMVKADTQNLEREYKPLFDSIMAEEDTLVYNPETGVAESSKQKKLQLLQERLTAAKKDIEDRATRAGIADMVLNTIYLPFNDMYMYGKLYGRGFKLKADLKGNITKGIDEAAKKEAQKTLGDRIIRAGREFATNPVSRRKAITKGLGMGLVEGAEEMNQAMFSTFTTSMNTPDSPDAYYKALTNPDYEVKTKDLMTSMTEAFQDSWLNPDTYKEGAIGFLTGIIGMPTFGKVNNSDHNTYLGRGKTIGLSGGMFGEMANTSYMNQQAENTVRTMNNFLKKVDDAEAFFVRSQSFTDAMDGWLEEGDKFEYENANDNDLFSAVDAFGRAGRIDDLKELVSEDFESITDEQLQDIAANSKSEEWLNPDGTSMASTPEGLNRMRQKLSEKQKKINEAIDSYEDALNEVRAYSNSGLTDDQTRELAWLKWKIGRFNERFKSIKEDNAEDIEDLRSATNSFMNGRGRGMIDEESEEGKTIINNMGVLSNFLELLSQSKSPIQVASLMKDAEKGRLLDFFENIGYDLLEGMTGLDSKRFSDLMTSLKDTIRLADATKSFNDRYKEFLEDPAKLLQNRDKIDKSNQKVNDAKGKQSTVNTVRELSAGELAREAASGNVDLDNILAQMEGAEDGTNEGSTSHEEEKNKVREAKELASAYDALRNQIQSSSEESEAARVDAQALLDAAFQNAESVDDLLDIDSEAYLDARNLASQSDLMDMDAAKDLLEETRSFLNREMAEFMSASEANKQMPSGATKVGTKDLSNSSQPTGRDSQDKLKTEQEKNQRQQEQEAKKSAREKIDRNFGVSLTNLVDSLPLSSEEKAQLSLLANAHKQDLDMHIDNGLTKEQINNIFLNDPINQQLLGSSPLFASLFNDYIDDRMGRANPPSADNRTGITTPSSSDRLDRVGPRTPDITSTPSTTYDPVNSSNPIPGEDRGSKHYLRPSAWEDIPNRDGVVTPYESTLSPSSKIDQATIDRMKAVRNYLIDNGAFDAVNNGVAKIGSEVTFVVVPSLNESAGDIVILMQIGGQVVGDIPGRKYSTFGSYAGLTDLVNDIEAEYNKFHKEHPDDVFKYDKFKPKVTQNMVGKIPYVSTYSTLNEIFGSNVQLGLCLSWNGAPSMFYEGGQTRRSRSSKDAQVMLPNSPVVGMPYVLVETSDPKRKYWPVRIRMPRYDGSFGHTLGKAINSAINDIANKAADPISLGEAILDLVAIDDIYIDYPDNDNVVVRIKQRGATNFTTVYNGLRNYLGFQEEIRNALKGNPYQISRKYINGKYKFYNNGVPVEVSYNSMIGELATANLPIGITHTKGDWFVTEAADGSSSIIKSIHLNPNATSKEVTVTEGAITFVVDTNTWDVRINGVIVDPEQKDVNTNKIRAKAFGQVKGYDTTKPYVTKWGNYSTKSNKFVDNSPKTIGADPSLDIPSLDDLDAAVAQARADMGRLGNQGTDTTNPFRTQNRGIREAENAVAQAVADNRALRREQALPAESGFTETGTSEVGVAFENDERAAEIQQALADSNRLKGEPPMRNYPQGNGLGRANSAVNQAVAENRRERAFAPPEGYNPDIWNETPAKGATGTVDQKISDESVIIQDNSKGQAGFQNQPQGYIKNKHGIWVPVVLSMREGYVFEDGSTELGGEGKSASYYIRKRVVAIQDGTGDYVELSPDKIVGIFKLGKDDVGHIDITEDIQKEVATKQQPTEQTATPLSIEEAEGNLRNVGKQMKDAMNTSGDIEEMDALIELGQVAIADAEAAGVSKSLIGNISGILKGLQVKANNHKRAKKNVTPETVQDFIQINNTNNGFSRIFPLNEWNKKDQDIRLEPDGWGTKNGLTYYKKSFDSGRKGDNVTVWFKNEPSSRVKSQIEVFLERGRRLDDTETLAKILNGEVIFYPSTSPLIDQVNRSYGGYFEGGGVYITDDYPGFNKALADKYENFYLGDGEFTEDDAKTFLDEIARIEQAKRQGTQPRPNPEIDQLSASDAKDMAKKKGLITGIKRQKVWEALTLDQQRRIASVPKIQGMKWMDTLEKSFNASNNTFNLVAYGSVDDLITNKPKFRLANEEGDSDTLEREKTWLKKVLPQFSDEEHLQIIEGLIKVAGSDQLAYGQFLNGIITLGSKAARGTLYHEAFHAVANTLLTEDEYNQMMEVAEEVYGNLSILDLEENLAEDFRRYVQLEETPVVGKLVRLFRKLKHFIQNLRGTEPYLNKLFYDINRGKFADRGLKDSNLTRYSTVTASRLQSIVDNVVNRAYPINTRDRYTLKKSRINRNSAWGRWKRSMERQLDATIKGYLDVNGNWKVASVIPNGPKYRKVSENNSEMVNACANFLSNFDIKINEINDYTGESPLFDALNRVINPSSEDDIPRATGYAIAFMMRNHPEISKILELKLGLQGNLKGFRRSIRVRGSYELSGGRKIKELKNNKELFDSYIHEIGDDIATEINRLFKGESINTEDSFLQKIWNTISEFFDKMNPSNRTAFLLLSNYTKHIANAVKLGDATIVLSTDNKPETISEATIVDVAKALRENPYEDNIVKKLNEEGIALAGGASIALDGTLYRPSENPLHDLDFNAVGFEKEDIERVLDKYFPNYQHIRTINNSDSEGEKRTETYLILDRPFRVEKLPNVGIYGLFDIETGEKLGTYVGSEFTPLNGHKGKFLDFFVGEGNRHFPNKTIRANNHDYLISDSRNAWLAKFTYGSRAKDYWDYARFRKNGSPLRLGAPNEVVRDRISKANIIWGHPAIGKTFYLETHNDILEWDELINKERNEFFKSQIDPDNLMSPEEYKVARTEYMANYREHPEYIRFLTEKWNWLKDKAKKENKKILASPLPLMQMFADDFDLFITLTNKDFLVRNMARGGSLMGSLGWKEVIDASLVNVDQSKIIRTESYFSEVMEENPSIKQHNRDKLMFGFLNKDQQDYIKSRIGVNEYNNMSNDMKEVFLHCM